MEEAIRGTRGALKPTLKVSARFLVYERGEEIKSSVKAENSKQCCCGDQNVTCPSSVAVTLAVCMNASYSVPLCFQCSETLLHEQFSSFCWIRPAVLLLKLVPFLSFCCPLCLQDRALFVCADLCFFSSSLPSVLSKTSLSSLDPPLRYPPAVGAIIDILYSWLELLRG